MQNKTMTLQNKNLCKYAHNLDNFIMKYLTNYIATHKKTKFPRTQLFTETKKIYLVKRRKKKIQQL